MRKLLMRLTRKRRIKRFERLMKSFFETQALLW